MAFVNTKDGTGIFYRQWGTGRPIVFSHGWPLNGDGWEEHLFYFASKGFRAIAHDRRGHGRSQATWNGNDMDTYADDLATVLENLDVKEATLVGHSTGGGEVARYILRHGSTRVSHVVLVGSVTPQLGQTASNPHGVPISVFDEVRSLVLKDRAQYYHELATSFYSANRPGNTISSGVKNFFWLQAMACGLKAAYDCIKQYSETDFTEDLKNIAVPVLVIHGDDDQVVPIELTAKVAVTLVQNGTLKVYPKGAHGLVTTMYRQLCDDIFEFINK